MKVLISKPHILREIEPGKDHVIEASAGTGKTYTIEHLVIDLLLSGTRISEILLVTFTEKATRELKDRIRRKIHQMAKSAGTHSSLHPLACWVIDRPQRRLLEEALLDFDNAAIYTIHGFCNQLLAEFAFENRQLFEMEQVRREELFDDLFYNYLRTHVLSRDEELRQLLLDYLTEKPEALSGGPDSLHGVIQKLLGKRGDLLPDVAAARRTWLTWMDFVRENDMAAVYERFNCNARTVQAWTGRLTDIHRAAQGDDPSRPLKIEMLKDKGLDSALDPSKWKFNKKAKPDGINGPDDVPPLVQRFIQLTRDARDNACDAEAALLVKLAPALREAMDEEKRTRGQLDFDDMIRLVAEGVEASRDQTGGGNLIAAVRRKYKVALIDEFQDTDDLQWLIFDSIFFNSPDHRLFLIGDPKQAIYGFRGADVNTYLWARNAMTRDPERGKLLHLNQNFRSSPEMIDAVNAVFTSPHIFQDGIRYDHPVSAGMADNRAAFPMGKAVTCMALWPEEGEAKLKTDDLREAFAHWIADKIQDILNHPDNRAITARNMAVLVRSAKTDLPILSDIFKQRRIPHTFYKQGGLFQTTEARELYDLLYAIENHGDESACFKALLSSFYHYRLGELFGATTLPETVRNQLMEWRKAAYLDRDYRKLFNSIFQETKIFERLLLHGDERRVTNFEHLADILKRNGANMDLKQLLQRYQSYMDGRFKAAGDEEMLRLDTADEAVRIMTIHASKGLEFEVVFVFGGFSRGNRDTFHEFHDPNRKKRVLDLAKNHKAEHERDQRSEDERLYYVALTRAKYKLFLPYVPLVDGKAPHLMNGAYGVLVPCLRDLENSNHPHLEFEYRTHIQRPRLQSEPDTEAQNRELPPPPAGVQHLPVKLPFRDILNRRARFQLSSYTKLAHRGEADAGLMARFELKTLDEVTEETTNTAPDNDLPRGRETGICLHEILERAAELRIDFHPVEDWEPWAADPAVRRIIEFHLTEYHLTDWYDQVAAVIHAALNMEIPPGVSMGRLPSRDRLHEIDFHFPIERSKKTVMLNGSIDLAFRHENRFYFADWKSDTMEDYHAQALGEKVRRDYQIQIQIYLQAMLRWLKIDTEADYEARFGGMIYLFLRGMSVGEGVYFHRPSWAEAQALYQELQALV